MSDGSRGNYLTEFLKQCDLKSDKDDPVLSLLLKYIITTDQRISEHTRSVYKTLLQLISGSVKPNEVDARDLALINEAFQELMEEMSSVEIDSESIKSMLTPEAFAGTQ